MIDIRRLKSLKSELDKNWKVVGKESILKEFST